MQPELAKINEFQRVLRPAFASEETWEQREEKTKTL